MAASPPAAPPVRIIIDYPQDGSIFPPDFAPPTFIWRDQAPEADSWRIEVRFGRDPSPIRATSAGAPPQIGEIDPRATAESNEPPALSPEQAAAHTWVPDAATWADIKTRSVKRPAVLTITGVRSADPTRPVSQGRMTLSTSRDRVGAPIFYRDVPLMPSETERGVIKPLSRAAIPLIHWRLRDVGEPRSRLLMTGLHTCANCHSFSRDGRTLGMDLDGPRNDKGMYAIANVAPTMSITNDNMVSWASFLGRSPGELRIGFMSQVSPDGRRVVTMISGREGAGKSAGSPGAAPSPRRRSRQPSVSNFYVANFKDYKFLQVFYPTGGILAWYDRATRVLQPLPGADDPRYVQTGATWSPDGKYLVFSRAPAGEPYPADRPMAEYANDPNETSVRYDLYRIPFHDGRGGAAEPVAGASRNGMSNSFPKISPDGRWIVFVQSRNGQLMRPDSQLYIVPAGGGKARRMRCNTERMNSWHSFSPNGRWMVFSSKARSPYTQMYLTHLDERGMDSPPILIENATAANRAVNIPEFVNIGPGGLLKIDVPAVEFYRVFDNAWELAEKGRFEQAIPEWRRALEMSPGDARVHMNLGLALAASGKAEEGIAEYRKALAIDPENPEIHLNLGVAWAGAGNLDEAVKAYEQALRFDPEYAEAHNNLGVALAGRNRLDEAIGHYRAALEMNPASAQVHGNLGVALARSGKLDEAIAHFQKALDLNPGAAETQSNLARAMVSAGRTGEAVELFQRLVEAHPRSAEAHNSLGVVLVRNRQAPEAAVQFEEAVRLNPEFVEARANLGETLYYLLGKPSEALAQWREVVRLRPNHLPALDQAARLLAASPDASIRNGTEAVALAERAAQLSGGRDPNVLDTLAAAYAEAGRFPDAVETARKAHAAARAANQPALLETIESRIAMYQAGTPLRLPR